MVFKLKGVYVLAISPMKKSDKTLDFKALERNLNHFIDAGVNGIVVGGTYAEYPSMNYEERVELFSNAKEIINKRVPLICCTASSNPAEALKLSKKAKELGVDGVMVTAPYVSEVRQDDIIRFFEYLSSNVDIPIFIYNSASIGISLSPQTIEKLAKIKNVKGVKHGSTNIRELIEVNTLVGKEIAILPASDSIALGGLGIGLPGFTSTNANFMIEEFVKFYNEFTAGDLVAAQKRFYNWQPIWDLAKKFGQPAMVKAAMEIVGLDSGPVRLPFKTLGLDDKKEIEQVIKKTMG
ncbi:dihydrodipicolinate synthase family protein [Liquorilactobacillus mali]|uniref:Dihydrodipicolinate synthetase n=1 Tax=Liquorilactobacillus mali KCTC 3596 = DSM 20444 TaxID=1046596 RepID=J0UUK3_9LACO|nr:dihydrodipicolinate synthase family protein [Liquorilactobacillus mali]EJF01606.1 dihydrodipicolinate synthetase [Liquorilactobacillus mali KCTC 3596 = DSM 20444]KRN08755.1 dihydrodipicolinate synthetase [Liquorilactobacillus mali KCTC 3596 = DSM 20444]QFQ74432.1 dihydrodipicolinate synthase family protein [Liquorilactobacillus mali]